MTVEIRKEHVVKLLVVFAVMLIVIHSSILGIYYYIDDPDKFDFVQMFDLDMEANIPTLFSSLLFTIASFLFFLNGKKEYVKRKYWWGLSIIFLFLSFDESAKIHENIGDLTEKFVDASGFLYYPWVISYTLLVLILGVVYFRFFWHMERKIFWRFVLAAVIFLSGAVGFELLGAREASLYGTDTPLYSLLYTIEESLEMFGVIYLISLLLTLLDQVTVKIES